MKRDAAIADAAWRRRERQIAQRKMLLQNELEEKRPREISGPEAARGAKMAASCRRDRGYHLGVEQVPDDDWFFGPVNPPALS